MHLQWPPNDTHHRSQCNSRNKEKQIIMYIVGTSTYVYEISCVQYHVLNNMNCYYVELKEATTTLHAKTHLKPASCTKYSVFYWSMKNYMIKKPVLHRKFALAFMCQKHIK